jgi:glycerophosphoryl diester phosphodiesterase
MIVYGHRGASAELPENTLEAFARALELGVDAIETDVHVTRDGHVVVHHDASARRMASDGRLVRDSTLEEMTRLNVGFGFRPLAGRDRAVPLEASYRVPTLEEALRRFPTTRFNVDIKPERGAVGAVLEVVRAARAEDRVLLTSFYDAVTREVRRRAYAGQTGLAQREAIAALLLGDRAPAFLRPAGQRIQLPTHVGPIDLVVRSRIARLQRLGLAVDFWVINDPAVARAARDAGADGVMTDDPRRIVAALRESPPT